MVVFLCIQGKYNTRIEFICRSTHLNTWGRNLRKRMRTGKEETTVKKMHLTASKTSENEKKIYICTPNVHIHISMNITAVESLTIKPTHINNSVQTCLRAVQVTLFLRSPCLEVFLLRDFTFFFALLPRPYGYDLKWTPLYKQLASRKSRLLFLVQMYSQAALHTE